MFDKNAFDHMESKLNGYVSNYFRHFTAYFYTSNGCLSPDMSTAKLFFRSKGGQCIDGGEHQVDMSKLTHIIVDVKQDKQCMSHLDNFFAGEDTAQVPTVLDHAWIIDCHKAKELLHENIYRV